MKVPTALALCVGMALMLGCSSLNVHNVTNNISSMSVATSTAAEIDLAALSAAFATSVEKANTLAALPDKKVDGEPVLCPVYKPLAMPKIPSLPYKELEAAGPGGAAKITEIERKHIEELRNFILRNRAAMVAHHQQYLNKCKLFLQQK